MSGTHELNFFTFTHVELVVGLEPTIAFAPAAYEAAALPTELHQHNTFMR